MGDVTIKSGSIITGENIKGVFNLNDKGEVISGEISEGEIKIKPADTYY